MQTEDKGLASPLILSLVYTGGEILASKRSPYDDLIAAGFDESALVERLSRQHKLICAAIHGGRIEDLKRMGQKDAAPPTRVVVPDQEAAPAALSQDFTDETPTRPLDLFAEVIPDTPLAASAAATAMLRVNLLEERELRGGQFATLRVRVSRGTLDVQGPVPDAHVVLKTLGTTFRPVSTFAKTDKDGIAIMFAALPRFTTGRGAILVRADHSGEKAELRRIILPT
ncbi:MAG: hypothetical protein QOD75_1468 [Blastocatellia bacterium]|nr:hypothetical protein [Blastocatellia bacterium]